MMTCADDWLEECLDTVSVPGALHVIMTSPGGHHKTPMQPQQQLHACRKGQYETAECIARHCVTSWVTAILAAFFYSRLD